jgi:hypothetical protein
MDDQIDRYDRYRMEGQELNSKLLDTLSDDELMEAAGFLDMVEQKDGEEILRHEDELDMPIHADFAIHRIEQDGSTAIEQFHQ